MSNKLKNNMNIYYIFTQVITLFDFKNSINSRMHFVHVAHYWLGALYMSYLNVLRMPNSLSDQTANCGVKTLQNIQEIPTVQQ